jgi:hypothetical protein
VRYLKHSASTLLISSRSDKKGNPDHDHIGTDKTETDECNA